MTKRKRLTECTESEYKEQTLYSAKQSFKLRLELGSPIDEVFIDMIEYVYDKAHNRGAYDARSPLT
ncbi:hypothetical protein D3C77_340660 [compost metagenome]